MRVRLMSLALVLLAVIALSTFLAAAQHSGPVPSGDFVPHKVKDWDLRGPDAERRRVEMLRRAPVRLAPDDWPQVGADEPRWPAAADGIPFCRFLNDAPSGTTAKFSCVLDGGAVIKVKYGRNPEIQGEVAGTRLLRRLGFPADEVEIVPRLRCYGCPRDPFAVAVAGAWTSTRTLLGPTGFDRGYSDFEWVAVERRFPAPSIETRETKGWSWWELKQSTAPRADLDALRLLAVFMAHWDNKAENQRLVCLDGPAPDPAPDCARPLAMVQDLGATFGPTKVNIGRWAPLPIWDDPATCRVSMRTLPWGGGTFPPVQISEAGRRQLADGLASIGDGELRDLFLAARFPEYQSATADDRDLRQWVAAFRDKARQILDAGPCPEA